MPSPAELDQTFMRAALAEALHAALAGEVPGGPILVAGGHILARAGARLSKEAVYIDKSPLPNRTNQSADNGSVFRAD